MTGRVRRGVVALSLIAETLWPPQVHAIFSTVVQTAGSIVVAVAALRLAPAGISGLAASAAGR